MRETVLFRGTLILVGYVCGLDDEKSCLLVVKVSVQLRKRRDTIPNRTEVGYRMEKAIE
jgi:hypothetical protein